MKPLECRPWFRVLAIFVLGGAVGISVWAGYSGQILNVALGDPFTVESVEYVERGGQAYLRITGSKNRACPFDAFEQSLDAQGVLRSRLNAVKVVLQIGETHSFDVPINPPSDAVKVRSFAEYRCPENKEGEVTEVATPWVDIPK